MLQRDREFAGHPNPSFSVVVVFLGLLTGSLNVSAQLFESGAKQVPLIELYTSEGCSSCPPADRWLSSLGDSDGLWRNFVPVAFHVDYWDYIGWQDPFASQEYSQRQRRYAREFSEPTVYTPGVRKTGKEWRRWYFSGAPAEPTVNTVGRIRIEVDSTGQFSASFPTDNPTAQLNVAVLGMGISSEVKRGENRGKTLRHDFVVLGLSRFATAQPGSWRGRIPQPQQQAPEVAIAAWVTENGSQVPLQATGGYLARSEP